MSAFQKGDRVHMTLAAVHLPGPRVGTVIGMSRNGEFVRVKRDGHTSVAVYAPEFWQRTGRKAMSHCPLCRRPFPEEVGK